MEIHVIFNARQKAIRNVLFQGNTFKFWSDRKM